MEQADEAGWEPFHDYRDNQFWGALRDIDRERAIRLVISSAVGQQRRIIGVPQLLQGVLDQEADHDLLLALAEEGERQAETVANSITAARAGFWPLAVKLLATYPDNEDIQDGVALGAERIRGGIISYWGSSADESEAVLSEVEQVLVQDETPEAGRPWLENFVTFLRERAARQRVEEADQDVER